MKPSFLPAVLSVFAICLSMCWQAHAADGKWLKDRRTDGYTLGIVTDSAPVPFVAAWKENKGVPPIAIYAKEGHLMIQLQDGTWGTTLTVEELIRMVRDAKSKTLHEAHFAR